jgi:hypothetical protein
LCLLGFGLNVHRVLHVFGVWFVFVKKIMREFFFGKNNFKHKLIHN